MKDARVEPPELEAGWLGTYEPLLYGYEGNAGTFVGDTLGILRIPITRVAAYCASGVEAVRNGALAVASGVPMVDTVVEQVAGARTGLAHTLGGPGAGSCVAVLGQP
jgi:acetyl-CoA C-acetyltransferase